MADPCARLDALLADALPVFEELADSCETVSRSVRCMALLMSAKVDVDRLVPHFETAMAAMTSLSALKLRTDAIVSKHNGDAP